MKKIENKKVIVVGKDSSYSEIIMKCNDVVPEKGWTPKSMGQAIKIDSLMTDSKEKESIELEDSDLEYIKNIVSKMPWSVKDKEIFGFCEYIQSIK